MFLFVSNRLRLYRAAAAYVIVAWLLIKLIETLSPLIYVPAPIATIILLLFLFGFAVTIRIASDHSTTTQNKAGPQLEPHSENRGGRSDLLLLAGLIIVCAFVFYEQIRPSLPANVSNTSWLWVSTTTHEGVTERAPKKSGMRFDHYTHVVHIWTDCNEASTTYSVSIPRRILLGAYLVTTALACPGKGPQDRLMTEIHGTSYDMRNGDLFLTSGLGTMRFVRVPEGAGGVVWASLLLLMIALPALLVGCCALDLVPSSASSRLAATTTLGRFAAGALILVAAGGVYLEGTGHRITLQEESDLRE